MFYWTSKQLQASPWILGKEKNMLQERSWFVAGEHFLAMFSSCLTVAILWYPLMVSSLFKPSMNFGMFPESWLFKVLIASKNLLVLLVGYWLTSLKETRKACLNRGQEMKFHRKIKPSNISFKQLVCGFCKLDICAKKFDRQSMEKLADRSMVLRELSVVKFGSVPRSLQSAKLTSESSF